MLFDFKQERTQKNCINAIESILDEIPKPKYSFDFMQVHFADSLFAIHQSDCPRYNPEKFLYVLEWSYLTKKWSIVSPELCKYYEFLTS